MGGLRYVATWELITGVDMTWVVCRRWAADISRAHHFEVSTLDWGRGRRRTLAAYELLTTP